MRIYQFKQVQTIQSDIDTVWRFFSSPRNLSRITPRDMNFEIIDSGGDEEIKSGQLIKYRVSPFPFLRLSWVTEICDVDSKRFFADNQVKGPFAVWYHQHLFMESEEGVEMTDDVSYSIPFGLIGSIANKLVVQHRVREIFEYRRKQIELIFPETVRQ